MAYSSNAATKAFRLMLLFTLASVLLGRTSAGWLRNSRRSGRERDISAGSSDTDPRAVVIPRARQQQASPSVREKVKAVAGVFTGVGREYFDRRQAVRKYWVPGTEDAARQLQKQKGVVVRFVMGFSLIEEENQVLAEEERLYGKMIRLNVREKYHNLVLKMRRYMQKVIELYDFDFALKVDDDVYHNPHRLSYAAQEWKAAGADYIGCFLQDNGITRHTNNKWFEPNAPLVGKTYFTYPAGPTYGVSQKAAALVSIIPDGALRYFGCGDDCSVASWMLTLNVTWHDDRRLCTKVCQDNSLTVRQGPGLKNPFEQLPELHANPLCSGDNKPGPPRPNEPDPARPNAPADPDFDFTNTNCYQLLSPTDTRFEDCIANHKDVPVIKKRPAARSIAATDPS